MPKKSNRSATSQKSQKNDIHNIHNIHNMDDICCSCGEPVGMIKTIGKITTGNKTLIFCEDCYERCMPLSSYKEDRDRNFVNDMYTFNKQYENIKSNVEKLIELSSVFELIKKDYFIEWSNILENLPVEEMKKERDGRELFQNECVKKCSDEGHLYFLSQLDTAIPRIKEINNMFQHNDLIQKIENLTNRNKVMEYDRMKRNFHAINVENQALRNVQAKEAIQIQKEIEKKNKEIEELRLSVKHVLDAQKIEKILKEYTKTLFNYFPGEVDTEAVVEAIARGDSKEVRRQLRRFLLGMLASPTSSRYSLPSSTEEKDVGNPKTRLEFDDIKNEKNSKNVSVSLKEQRGRILTKSKFRSRKSLKLKKKLKKSIRKTRKSK